MPNLTKIALMPVFAKKLVALVVRVVILEAHCRQFSAGKKKRGAQFGARLDIRKSDTKRVLDGKPCYVMRSRFANRVTYRSNFRDFWVLEHFQGSFKFEPLIYGPSFTGRGLG